MNAQIWDLEEEVVTLRDRASRLRSDGNHREAHLLEREARGIDAVIDMELQEEEEF